MVTPPIITDEFLLTCLQYEYHKNNGNPREAYRNLCQMMQSMDIRREDAHVDEVVLGDSPPRDAPVALGPREVVTLSSDSSDDPGSPEAKKRKIVDEVTLSDDSDSDPSQPSTSEPKSILKRKTPEKADEQQQQPRRVAFESGSEDSSSTDVDSDDETPMIQKLASLTLVGKQEQNVQIDTISLATMENFFENFQEAKNPVPMDQKCWVHDLRCYAFSFVLWKLQKVEDSPKGSEHPYTDLKSTVDFHKVKITLKTTDKSETSQLEFWHQEKGGSWIWHNDDVRFIQDLDYETLAANEFMDCLSKSCEFLESLEFDIEKKTGWTPKLEHSAAFWYKVKKCVRISKLKIGAKKFSMKVLKCREKVDCPFKLKLINSGEIEEIKLRVWDDSYRRRPSQIEYLVSLQNDWQWGVAKILDIQDPNLDFLTPDVSTFDRVKRWSIKSRDEEEMRKFLKNNNRWRKCRISAKEPIDLSEFILPEWSRDVTSDENIFTIIIEKSGITYEVIETPESKNL